MKYCVTLNGVEQSGVFTADEIGEKMTAFIRLFPKSPASLVVAPVDGDDKEDEP